MSMKKKRRGDKVGHCLVCGGRLRRHDPACKRCGHRSPLFAPKAAGRGPYLVKGGNVVPIRVRRCWNTCPANKSSAKFCVGCGEQLGISYGQHMDLVAKASDPASGTYWGDKARHEADPGRRELMLKMARGEPGYGFDAAPAFLAKAASMGGVW